MNHLQCIRDKHFFLCQYTGAPLKKRYFIPAGRGLKKKEGAYATLPIALRHVYEQEGGATERFSQIKTRLEKYFDQPDIPLQPIISAEEVPLSESTLEDYLFQMDMGRAWMDVPKAETVAEAVRPSKKRRKLH